MAVAWRSAAPSGPSAGSSGRRPKRAPAPIRTIAGRERPLPPHVLRHRPPPSFTVESPAPAPRHRPATAPRRTAGRPTPPSSADQHEPSGDHGRRGGPGRDPAPRRAHGHPRRRAHPRRRRARRSARATTRSARPTSPRSPARRRCTAPTRGCSSRAVLGGRPNPQHLEKAAYLELGRAGGARGRPPQRRRRAGHARRVPRRGARSRPSASASPSSASSSSPASASTSPRGAEAELAPPAGTGPPPFATGGGYDGPLAYRQGKPMRPDVALAFDRLDRAARADGVALVVASGFRSDAEQAVLFARNPDPKWVAPPGDVAAPQRDRARPRPARRPHGWLAANAPRFHFVHALRVGALALGLHPQPALDASARTADGALGGRGAARVRPAALRARDQPRRAALDRSRPTLLAAQLYAESGFNPFAVSPAGAQGIAQFMPGTARGDGPRRPVRRRRRRSTRRRT